MTEDKLADHSVAVFLQALGITIWNIEDLKPEDRNRENFIRGFDGYLGEIAKHAEEIDGLEVQQNVKFLRDALQQVLDQMKLAKTPAKGSG